LEIWYRLEHNLSIFKRLPVLPAYAPAPPTIFTPFFWKDYRPDNLWLTLAIYTILSIILTAVIFLLIYIVKKISSSKTKNKKLL